MLRFALLVTAVGPFLIACERFVIPIPPVWLLEDPKQRFEELVVGVTTRSEAINLLGRPLEPLTVQGIVGPAVELPEDELIAAGNEILYAGQVPESEWASSTWGDIYLRKAISSSRRWWARISFNEQDVVSAVEYHEVKLR